MRTSFLRKLLYRVGLMTPFWKVDRVRYLKRLARNAAMDWRYVASDDAAQFTRNEVVAQLAGVSAPVFFYCDRNASSIEAEILKSVNTRAPQTHASHQRWRVLELGIAMIRSGSRVIDVGANIGIYALPWAALNADVVVHCFEPNSFARARLERNVALNRLAARVLLHAEALSDCAGTAILHGSDDMATLNEGVHSGGNQAHSSRVPVRPLDEVIDIEGVPVSLVKIDVQGHELEVLRGARRIVSRHRPALILEHEDNLFKSATEARQRKEELAALLTELGYETLYVSRWGTDLLTVADWSRHLNGDLLALPVQMRNASASS